jgi:hypothetical protein
MSRARVVRWVVIGVCAVGIAGMIGGSAVDNSDLALTFGLITAAAVLCLMVATAVAAPATTQHAASAGGFDEGQAARVEHLVERLVVEGAPEDALRQLVSEAVRLGRGARESQEIPHVRPPIADD